MFKKHSIGLDIADHTIEVIELEKTGGKVKIKGGANTKLSPGIVDTGRIKDKEELKKVVKKVFAKAKPSPITGKKINFNLPNSAVYSFVLKIEKSNEKESEDLVLDEILKSVPIKKDKLLYSYKKISNSEEHEEFLVIAVNRGIVKTWHAFFSDLGIKLDNFDIEAFASFRALDINEIKTRICIVDIGARTTNIYFWDKTGLVYSHIIKIGGNRFTSSIILNTTLDEVKAEMEKKKVGLKIKSKKVKKQIEDKLTVIINKISEINKYLSNDKNEKLDNIILVGGSSQMPGLVEYFQAKANIKSNIGKVTLSGKKVSLTYLGAVGLAMKKISSKWNDDLSIKYEPKEEEKEENKKAKIDNIEIVSNTSGQKKKLLILLAIVFFGALLVFIIYKFKH